MLAAAGVNQRIGLFANIETARALSAIATRNLDALAPWADIATKLNTPPLAAAPLSAYRRYLDRSDEDLTDHRLAMGAVSSFAIGGATAAQVLLADDGDANDDALVLVTDVSEQVEDELIAPWRAGQLDAAQDLRDRLGVFDATVPEMLDGAWLDIARPGPAQLVKVSACAVEAIDRALRAVAPDDDVEAWVAATGLKPSRTLVIYSDRGTLTRQVRIRYATRARTADRRLIETQEKSLSALAAELTSRFNAGKHASQGGLVHARTLLMTAEALLSQLVLPND